MREKRVHRAPKPPIVPVNNLGAVMEKSPATVAILQQRIAGMENEITALAGREIDALAGWAKASNELDRLKSLRGVRFALWVTGNK